MAKIRAIIPQAFRTAGDAKAAGVRIAARCSRCGVWKDAVDLDAIISAKGQGCKLVGRRTRCTFTDGCDGWVKFHYLNGVMRPLWEDVDEERWMALE